ncbi:MAG: hypothetical protein P1S46_06260 [bacterium]|nr:hypothetical protein [bacterium]
MTTHFHNTTHQVGEALRIAVENARTQEEKVEVYFRSFPAGHAASASRIHQAIFGWSSPIPLTSTRRALTNLTTTGVLEKTCEKTDGAFGRPEHKYRLLPTEGQMRLL